MTTMADIEAYRRGSSDLTALALREVNDVLSFLGDANPVTVRNSLIQLLPEIVGPYITASGELAATWYEDLRSSSVGGTYYATASGELNQARINSLVRYGVKPLFGQSSSTVLSLIGGGVQRMVSGAGRATIADNASRDRVRVGFARIARPDACAFCGMLASRGAEYASEASAGGVVGRGVSAASTKGKAGGQGKGLRGRGSRAIGSNDYHDSCHCVVAPVFRGDTFATEAAAPFKALYDDAFEINEGGAISAKETLANWRQVHGTK
jgi:hypothetical protein